jgi:hypothetical protein
MLSLKICVLEPVYSSTAPVFSRNEKRVWAVDGWVGHRRSLRRRSCQSLARSLSSNSILGSNVACSCSNAMLLLMLCSPALLLLLLLFVSSATTSPIPSTQNRTKGQARTRSSHTETRNNLKTAPPSCWCS